MFDVGQMLFDSIVLARNENKSMTSAEKRSKFYVKVSINLFAGRHKKQFRFISSTSEHARARGNKFQPTETILCEIILFLLSDLPYYNEKNIIFIYYNETKRDQQYSHTLSILSFIQKVKTTTVRSVWHFIGN